MKKLLSVLLAVMMLLSALPVMAEETPAWDVIEGEHYANFEDATGLKQDVTCTENGWVEYECQDPDCTVKTFRVEVLAQGHKHDDKDQAVIITPATCEGEGLREWQTCLVCGQKWTEVIEPIGHSWEVKKDADGKPVIVEPWCTTEGYTVYECVREGCDAEKNADFVPALGHDWAVAPQFAHLETVPSYEEDPSYYIWTEVDSATCIDTGKLVKFTYCDRCKHKDIITDDSNYWPVLEHQSVLEAILTIGEDETIADVVARVEALDAAIDGVNGIIACPGHAVESTEDNYKVFHHNVEIIVDEPTCVETGLLTLACTKCEAEASVVLPATGHNYSYKYLDEASIPTCLEDGKLLVVCTKGCGYEEQINVAAPGKHNWNPDASTYSQVKFFETVDHGTFDQIATCIDYTEHQPCAGYEVTVELKNGYVFTFIITGCTAEFDVAHKGTGEHNKATENYAFRDSTCTEEGYEYFYCHDCGYTYGQVIPMKDHVLESVVITKPGCTTDGLIHWNCVNCHQTIEEQIVPMTGHNYGLKEHKKETCTTDGYDLWVCSYCGDNYKEVIPHHHFAPALSEINPNLNNNQAYKAPTCTETGLMSYECTVCHQPIINEVIPALGHEWSRPGYVYGNYVAYDYVNHKYVEMNNAPYAYEYDGVKYERFSPATCLKKASYARECEFCGKIESIFVGEVKGHLLCAENENGITVSSLVLDTNCLPTCTSTGKAYYNCVVCGKLVEDFEMPALPHYEITVWNPEKRVYEVSCEKAPMAQWDSIMADYMWAEILELVDENSPASLAKANEVYVKVMNELKTKLAQKDSEFISGIDCDKVKEIPVNKTHYSIALDGTTVTLTPDENCALLKNPMIIVNWAYTLSDGTAFSYTRLIKAEDLATLNYDLGLAEAPAGSELESITVIVTDTATLDITVAAKGYGYAQF